jgi:methylase of polypeptide subunit release factors
MLGRVFEGLMDQEQRHRSGTYYTPASLVERIVGVAVSVHADHSSVPLADMTILDPAVGSGAFLLGALEHVVSLTRGPQETAATARRRVLARNLFGVDLDPTAVRLAELRLWLAVIADDETTNPEAVPPLPNLDAVVRQGDTLWSRQGLHRPDADVAAELRGARHCAITAAGGAKRPALRALRRAEEAAEASSIARSIEVAEARIGDLLEHGRSETLFGEQRGLTREEKTQLAGARMALRELRTARRRLMRDGGLPTFDYAVHFADVMAAGGFDLVIGNPPWVRSEALPRPLRQRLAQRYRLFRPSGNRGYQNYPDLSVAFVERGLELTREGGVVALLIPAKLRHAGYASALRRALASTTTLYAVADMPPDDAKAFDATVYPMALVTRRACPPSEHHTRTTLHPGGPCVPQSSLEGDGPWMLAGAPAGRVAERLARECQPFRTRWQCALGVKTGADDVYLTEEPDIEPQLMRRAVRGRDIRPGIVVSTRWIRWPCDELGNALKTLPPRAAAYFKSKRDRLSRRADYRDGPPWTLFRTRAALGAHRVVWPDLARRLEAAALTGHASAFIPMNTCYVLNAPDGTAARVIAALLNSTWIRALATMRAPLAASGFRRFNARVIEDLPFPAGTFEDRALVHAATGTLSDEAAVVVDERLAHLLELTPEERNALSEIIAVPRC